MMQDAKQSTNESNGSERRNKNIPVAVIGLGCLFPGSSNAQGYWRDILSGRNQVTQAPPSHLHLEHFYDPDPHAVDKTYCKQGAFLSPVEFDPIAFGIPPKNLSSIDSSQLLSLMVAKQVLEDAFHGKFKDMDRSRVGIIMGVAAGLDLLGEMAGRLTKYQWVKGMREAGLQEDEIEDICKRILDTFVPWNESTFPGLLGNVVSGRIANHFDLGGINCTSDAACASSFSALSQGLHELYLGTSDVVIVGGADTNNDSFLFVSFSKTPALSPTHDCRPFSDKADGMVLGEGIGMMALKRLDDALRDGDKVYAVIKGVGASSDGAGTSIYAPVAKGQESALRRCYAGAAYDTDTVELVEAHGTGTPTGDVIEVQGLQSVFTNGKGREDKPWCALGSVKSQIGHTKSTAATAGIIKAVLALHHKVLPPTIKVERPNPKLGIENSPFYINTQARPWVRDDSHPRRAGVSSFGFGGTNFHVTLEEYRGPASAHRLRNVPSELIVLSASDALALKDICLERAASLETDGMLTYLAQTSQEQFDPSAQARLAIVAANEADLQDKLKEAAKLLQGKPGSGFSTPGGIYCSLEKANPGDAAFLFPGQGASGYVGMGADLAMSFSDAADIWDRVATFDKNRQAEESLHRVVFPVPVFTDEDRKAQAEKLKLTRWAQPAVLTTSLLMSRMLKGLGIQPVCVGGHSLGEISALYDAGVVDFEDLLKVCFKRADLMAQASLKPGTMTAAFGEADRIQNILDKVGAKIVIANHNDPTQVVLSGPVLDMEKVESALKEEKIKFIRLPVSAAFHSFLMDDACAPFLEYLKTVKFKAPAIPVYSNISGRRHDNKADKIRNALAAQINSPVQFVKEVEEMYNAGARIFIEAGPSDVLSNLVDKILKDSPHTTVNMDSRKENGVTALWKAMGKLAVAGVPLNFAYMWKDHAPVNDPRQKEKPKFSVTLTGANYGKKYPCPDGLDSFPKPNPKKQRIVDEASISLQAAPPPEKNKINDSAMAYPKRQPEEIRMNKPTHNPAPAFAAGATPSAAIHPSSLRAHGVQQAAQALQTEPLADPRQGRHGDASYMAAYLAIQRQTAEAHAVYQKTMSESHLSFLKAAESSNMALCAMLTGQPMHEAAYADLQTPTRPLPVERAVNRAPVPSPGPTPTYDPKPSAPVSETSGSVSKPPRPEAESIPEPVSVSPKQKIDLTDMFLNIVADKTGYPLEILKLDMNLEADLGIDSIKRVEIFSAIKDKVPSMPEINPADMSGIHTLGDVIAFIEKQAPQAAAPASPQARHETAPSATPVQKIDLTDMFLNIVADKTGYPLEILKLDMNLEADLGIDSIKRVEIFSAIKDKVPSMPEINPADMSGIHTLGDVIAFIEKQTPQAAAPASPQARHETAPSAPPVQKIDLTDMFLNIVADKTGYPLEILKLDMNLEADLGIDSIKRVEIFSAIKDKVPSMPEINPADMSGIHTLGDVIAFIEKQTPQAAAPASPQARHETAPSAPPVQKIDLTDMFLNIVADKTGYPLEILKLDMNLEADLGIDSIKRVEIFSAIKDKVPSMPEINPADMSGIHTLGDVIAFIGHSTGETAGKSVSGADAVPAFENKIQDGGSIGRYILKAVSAPHTGFAMAGLKTAARLCVLDANAGVAEALVQILKQNEISAERVTDVPEDCDALIFLGGLRKISGRPDAMAVNREAFAAAKSMAGRLAQSNGVFVTVQDTGGDFGLSGQAGDRAWLGGLTGLVKSAAIEWPKASVKAIDIECGRRKAADIAEAICQELLTGGPETEVGIKKDGSRRRLKSYEDTDQPLPRDAVSRESIILVSGGARGVTAQSMIQLAKQAHPRLVVLGRTRLEDEPACCGQAKNDAEIKRALLAEANAKGEKASPKDLGRQTARILAVREIKANLEAMKRAGSEAMYVAVDVLDAAQLKKELDKIRKDWGPFTGLVHGAGVLADKRIAEKTIEQFDWVFNTKVKGLEALLDATAADPLETICLFSSIAGRTGNMGQSDYAMANEVLNKVAGTESFRRKGTCLVKSINWGPWDGGMVSTLLKDYFEEKGIPLIPVDTGARYFVDEIMGGSPKHVEVVVGPKPPDGVHSISPVDKVINLSVCVDKETYPFIESHRIKDVPVVPLALVLEWFSKAAEIHSPDMNTAVCRNVKVLRGIALKNFADKSDHLNISCQQAIDGDAPHQLALTLPAPGGGTFYSADVEMSFQDPSGPAITKSPKNGLPSWKWSVSEIYQDKLFHGPEFQVIRSLEGIDKNKATCILDGTNEMSWPETSWKNDVAALDGGLQLAILWGKHHLNKTSLPTKIGAYHRYQNGPIAGPIYCELNGKFLNHDRSLSDISFFNGEGKLAAKFCDVEMHMLPEKE